MFPLVHQKLISNDVGQQDLPKTSTKDFKSYGSKNNSDLFKLIRELPRLVRVLAFEGDHPVCAEQFDLAQSIGRLRFAFLCQQYCVCQFKDKTAYNKDRRMVKLHNKGVDIRIGRFQGLVESLGYQPLPLSESAKEAIRTEHRLENVSVSKLSDDWDVSESHIREILKGDKPPVSPSADPIKQVFSEGEPPIPSRVGAGRGGYDE